MNTLLEILMNTLSLAEHTSQTALHRKPGTLNPPMIMNTPIPNLKPRPKHPTTLNPNFLNPNPELNPTAVL